LEQVLGLIEKHGHASSLSISSIWPSLTFQAEKMMGEDKCPYSGMYIPRPLLPFD
jgi:hypothetical protein